MIRRSLLMLLAATCGLLAQDKPFRPEPGKFPPIAKAKSYRGELVFVDHINRRGSMRLHIDGHFHEGRLHDFAMLPYGMIYYRGAPAQLRDIPIGTVLYGRFYLPPDPKTSAVPLAKGTRPSEPAETHAILLEDGPSFCLREGKSWKLKQIEYKGKFGFLTATLARKEGGEGLGGEHRITIDPSTRIWRGRELLGINDLIKEGVWPGDGTKALKDQPVQLSLAWHPRYLYQQFHMADIWLDDAAIKIAATRQMERHNRYIRYRWMPARVTAVKHGKFGHATVTATLFGGMDPRLYADFKPGLSGQMAVAENTLRTYWQNHDGMEGKIETVTKMRGETPFGSSGIQVQFSMNLVLEGFRPGRLVRIRPQVWPKIKPPVEEQIRSLEDRWPSPDIFKK
jgi:hypothetical protein